MNLRAGTRPVSLLRGLWAKTKEDNAFNGAAALGFFLTLAIFPALILVMSVIPYLPIKDVDRAIMDFLAQVLPPQGFEQLREVIQQIVTERRGALLSLGALTTLWAASTGMYAIMQQLNVTYDVKETRGFLHARAVAIGLSILFGALMLIVFSLVVLGGVAQGWIGERFGFSDALLMFFAVLRWVVIVLALMLAFSLTYRLAPDVENNSFRYISRGGVAGTLMLVLASFGFAVYVQNFANYQAVYGSIGAVIVLMLWLYIAGLSLLVGAEINVLVERRGR